jgi:flagellum-specific peptidoglycan hydrolase FlgJ
MTKNQFLSTMEQAWILAGHPNVNKAVLFAQAWLETGHGGGLFLRAFNIFWSQGR